MGRFKCPICERWFKNYLGCQTHIGMMHGFGPMAHGGRKRSRDGPPLPIVPIPEGVVADDDDGPPPALEEESASESDDDGEEEEDEQEEEEEAPALSEHDRLVQGARAEARSMLLVPAWRKWARDQRLHCEEILQDVGQLFPSAEDFPTDETYRFTKLYYQHPGASFGPELLKEDTPEHPLDLSKVTHTHLDAFAWSHIRRICDFSLD